MADADFGFRYIMKDIDLIITVEAIFALICVVYTKWKCAFCLHLCNYCTAKNSVLAENHLSPAVMLICCYGN